MTLNAQHQRAFRERKRAEKERHEFEEFIVDTPFSSSTTDEEKYAIYITQRQTAKVDERKRKNAESNKRYRENKKLKIIENVDNKIISAKLVESEEVKNSKSILAEPACERRAKHKLKHSHVQQLEKSIIEPLPKHFLSDGDREFSKQFLENQLGVARSLCDRLWFEPDAQLSLKNSQSLYREKSLDEDVARYQVCQTCYKALLDENIPHLSKQKILIIMYTRYHRLIKLTLKTYL